MRYAFLPLVLVPLPSGRLGLCSGFNPREYLGSIAPEEIGALLLSQDLHRALDIPAPMQYTNHTESDLGITIEL